jgi:hypothetical protein
MTQDGFASSSLRHLRHRFVMAMTQGGLPHLDVAPVKPNDGFAAKASSLLRHWLQAKKGLNLLRFLIPMTQ